MKTLDNKSVQIETIMIDGLPTIRVKPNASLKKLSLRPRKSFTRVKSLRPLKAAGKASDITEQTLD